MAWRKALHRLKIGLVLLGTVLVLGFVSTLVPWKPLGTWFASLSYLAVAGLVGGACVIFGLLSLTPTLARRYWAGHVSGWWYAIGLIVVPIVATTATALWVLLAAVDTPQASDRIDVIRTALTIGGGTGGVVALVLVGRRQWRSEVTAHSSEHDATERRITDLYTKAADQLGSAKAPVRLAGLYALERLAQNNRDLRQTVVNVMCAYLRMPHSSSTGEGSNESAATQSDALAEQEQERQVRLAAQRIISDHLRPGAGPDPIILAWNRPRSQRGNPPRLLSVRVRSRQGSIRQREIHRRSDVQENYLCIRRLVRWGIVPKQTHIRGSQLPEQRHLRVRDFRARCRIF